MIPPGGGCESEIIGLDSSNQHGDLNNDGNIDILDIIQVVNLILSNEFLENGDLNNDSTIDILDIILLVNIILNN